MRNGYIMRKKKGFKAGKDLCDNIRNIFDCNKFVYNYRCI